jgi:ribosomal-protein-alanine N-acetyltransferase
MLIRTARFQLRDFATSDRQAFVAYQMDPRYRRLYDFGEADEQRAQELFDLFLSWEAESPRLNLQLGIFEQDTTRLCGCAGLRRAGVDEGTAVLGIELTPDNWGRYKLALEVADAMIEHGFRRLGLRMIIGTTASGNKRVERLAGWFGAHITARRDGPKWMAARGWFEMDWALARDDWTGSDSGRCVSRPGQPGLRVTRRGEETEILPIVSVFDFRTQREHN